MTLPKIKWVYKEHTTLQMLDNGARKVVLVVYQHKNLPIQRYVEEIW